jgi:hypothetical protein
MICILAIGISVMGCRTGPRRNSTVADSPAGPWTLSATGIGYLSDSAASTAQARLLAETAAETDAQRRLVVAIFGAPKGTLTDARRVKTEHVNDGRCRVTVECDVDSYDLYLRATERLK